MFKKLKEKITEEVKISPQRFQQLTQSVSDRLQNPGGTSDDNFFSIGEEDDANSSMDPGFSSVSLNRRNSNSSLASDVSFLPRYESNNSYHLQSDWDASASEMEDNVSGSSSLGHLSKEQIHSAFQKSQLRYHKYRGRYTDLARHYKDMEREIAKMKSVLVETQDKAIRRVTELKEQCGLEQKAKAHLEGALRDELDEKQLKIQSLETKIELLQHGDSSQVAEVDDSQSRIQELKANLIVFQSKEGDYKARIAGLEQELQQCSDRERENNLAMAQTKMELHNEMLSRDSEISRLKHNLEVAQSTLKQSENLQGQNRNLIDKLESATAKCNSYEVELLKVGQYKQEIERASRETETVRVEAQKALLSLEDKIRAQLAEEFSAKESQLRADFSRKIEDLSQSSDSEQSQLLVECRQLNEKLTGERDKLSSDLAASLERYKDLETNHLNLIEEGMTSRSKIGQAEKEMAELRNENLAYQRKIQQLEINNDTQDRVIEELRRGEATVVKVEDRVREFEAKIAEDSSTIRDLEQQVALLIQEGDSKDSRLNHLNDKIIEFHSEELEFRQVALEKSHLEQQVQKLEEQVRIFEERNQAIDLEKTESRLLEMRLQTLEEENRNLVQSFEKERVIFEELLADNTKLKESQRQVEVLEEAKHNLEVELGELKSTLGVLESDYKSLASDKLNLDTLVGELKQEVRLFEEKNQAVELELTESKLLEMKLQAMEEERGQIQQTFEYERNLFDAQKSGDHQQICDLQGAKSELTLKLQESDNKLRESEDEVVRLKCHLDDLTRDLSVAQLRSQSLDEEKRSLLSDLDTLKNQLEETNYSLKSQSSDLGDFVHQLLVTVTKVSGVQIKNNHNNNNKWSRDDLTRIVAEIESSLLKLEYEKSERLITELMHEKQLLQDEVEELKTTPLNSTNHSEEIDALRHTVDKYKSLDLTNRTSIDFYETELQKLKNHNEKLSVKLDETLVTLNHCTELGSSTEIEYLRNVLYNYMLGKEGLVLARVIAAVCKFDPEQTETVLAKEQQKQSLLGHLGIL